MKFTQLFKIYTYSYKSKILGSILSVVVSSIPSPDGTKAKKYTHFIKELLGTKDTQVDMWDIREEESHFVKIQFFFCGNASKKYDTLEKSFAFIFLLNTNVRVVA
ncbi:hypothetical protein [Oceanobacillus oncorhynchi]|uniref:hypothetical protein n=1 Tax=Oceanobacillus oncorhynchi TaxID=545501 RepID=UPI002F967EB2